MSRRKIKFRKKVDEITAAHQRRTGSKNRPSGKELRDEVEKLIPKGVSARKRQILLSVI